MPFVLLSIYSWEKKSKKGCKCAHFNVAMVPLVLILILLIALLAMTYVLFKYY